VKHETRRAGTQPLELAPSTCPTTPLHRGDTFFRSHKLHVARMSLPYLFARQNPLDDARNTLSSWDNCMAKNYCKFVHLSPRIYACLHTRQMASNRRNCCGFPYTFLSCVLHSAMSMLRCGMHHMLLQVLHLLLWQQRQQIRS
jgi:hypothetical protein